MLRIPYLWFLLVLATPLLGVVSAQDQVSRAKAPPRSLTERLEDAKHVGLTPHPRGYIMHVFTEQQHRENLVSLARYRADLAVYEKQMGDLVQRQESTRLAELRRQGRRVTLNDAEANAREAIPKPELPFAATISLKEVVDLGTDYIEVQSSPASKSTTLIPFGRLYKVIAFKESSVPR